MVGKVDDIPGAGEKRNITHKNGKMAGKVDNMPGAGRGKNTTELIKMEKWRDDMPGAGDKQTELIKMEKWREKWTLCLAPGGGRTQRNS
jgi:hypothetical protein